MDPKGVELGEGVHQLPQAARESVVAVDEDGIESAPLGIREQAIQRRTRFLAPRHAGVDVFLDDLPLPTPAVRPQLLNLHRGVLLRGRNTPIECDSHTFLLFSNGKRGRRCATPPVPASYPSTEAP